MMELAGNVRPTDCTENTMYPCEKKPPKPSPKPKGKKASSHPGITHRQVAQLKGQLQKRLTQSL
jgi:hypothetical protein